MLLFYLYSIGAKNKKVAELLAYQIEHSDNNDIKERVFGAAIYTSIEKDVLNLFKRRGG